MSEKEVQGATNLGSGGEGLRAIVTQPLKKYLFFGFPQGRHTKVFF